MRPICRASFEDPSFILQGRQRSFFILGHFSQAFSLAFSTQPHIDKVYCPPHLNRKEAKIIPKTRRTLKFAKGLISIALRSFSFLQRLDGESGDRQS